MANAVKFRKHLTRLLLRAITLYMLLCLCLWWFQRHLMYHPSHEIQPPAAYALSHASDITLHTSDDVAVHVWYQAAEHENPTIVFFHGNGGNLSHRATFFQALTAQGLGVLALDYRGYGASGGTPTEAGLYLDAQATLLYARDTLHIPAGKLVLYGESLGTGVAVHAAAHFPSAALVLQSPFTSLEAAGAFHYPWLPVHLLIQDRFPSIDNIAQVHVPLLLMHGEKDQIVPITQGKELFAAASMPKESVYFPSRGHNDLGVENRLNALVQFLRHEQLLASSSLAP